MLVRWWHVVLVLVVAPVAIVLAAWIGFFNVGASSGHWKITDWFLHFAMRSAIRTYAIPIEPPPELPADGVQPAAGHYATGCAICHGAPGEPRSPAVLRMLPLPPDLDAVVEEWSDAELFRIVKHGVRFTGMPAWPSLARDDEVWEMVAFLRELPDMEAERYRDLAYGEAGRALIGGASPGDALADCARCHGVDGVGKSSLVPIIAGQSETYLFESLRAYHERRRASGIMALPANDIEEAEWAALARHYAAQPAPPPASDGLRDLIEAGREIAERGVQRHEVPACLGCHGVERRNPVYPNLDGQHAPYLEAQLHLFRAGERGGTAYNHLMATAAKGLTDEEIRAVAAFFASREPPSPETR